MKPSLKDIINLPQDHPLYIKFMKDAEEQSNVPALETGDEEGISYFNRYITGDR